MSKPFIVRDKYAKMAQEQNFRARSVFKLMELDKKFKILKPGLTVLDIGAAPGSWIQYASEMVGSTGKILGLDITPIEFIALNVETKICDITDETAVEHAISEAGLTTFDLILSDIAPSTTGITSIDHGKSINLSRTVVEIAQKYLDRRGMLVMKVFEGKDFQKFVFELKRYYKNVAVTKVHSTRERSKEKYIICY